MNKGQHGNKEAKKPKKLVAPVVPAAPADAKAGALAVAALRSRKRY